MILSFVNLVATATVTASTSDSTYGVANVKTPQRRGLPWKSTVQTATSILVDFGVTTTIGLIGLVKANFATCSIQGNATDSWASPTYNQAVTVAQNGFNFQRQHFHAPSAFAFRYLRILIGAQTPQTFFTEDPSSVFRLGGLWAGAAVTPPAKFNVEFEHERDPVVATVAQPHGAYATISARGNPVVELRRKRGMVMSHAASYLSDDAKSWLVDVDAEAWRRGYFALFENNGNPSMGWIVRMTGGHLYTVSDREPEAAEADWTLKEVVRA